MANAINSLNYENNIYTFTLPYGVCGTAADTAAKEVTVDNFSLETGATVIVKFTYANSIASPTLNVNGTGAKPIYRYGTTATSTGTTTTGWVAGAVQMFTYDGTGWIRDYWNNTTYSNVSLGQGYATCETAAATAAKVGTLSSYALTTGGIVSVKFTYDVPASATLNINGKGAKSIYYRGAAITAGIIKAGDVATFIYSSRYHLISIDRWQQDIDSKQAIITGAATTITGSNLTASRALISNSSGKVAVSAVTSTELGYLDGVTSSVQTQLDGKVPTSRTVNGKALTGNITLSASDVGASASSHEHSAAKITSGILAIERGGTGNSWGYVQAGAESGSSIGALATAEGRNVTASGDYSHAEGNYTEASGSSSHAEGQSTTASGNFSHAEGESTTASGKYSHAEGQGTIAKGDYSHAQGKYNIEDTSGAYAHIVGNGESNSARSNAHTVDWAGNAWFAGNIYVGGTSQSNSTNLVESFLPKEEFKDCIQAEKIADFTNKLPMSINSSGAVFSETGYMLGKRWNGSDGTLYDAKAYEYGCTGFIPLSNNSIIRTNGITFLDDDDGWCCIVFYDSSFNRITHVTAPNMKNGTATWYTTYTEDEDGFQVTAKKMSDLAYATITFAPEVLSKNPIVTINETITYHMDGTMADGIKVNGEYTILTAPNGTKYKLTVSDTGALSAVAV